MKHLKALGLIEVLVVLAIFATAIIGISQFTTVAFVSIRQDELVEYGTGIMLKGLELAKSPSSLTIFTPASSTAATGSYTYKLDSGIFTLQKVFSSVVEIDSCDENSDFLVPSDNTVIMGETPEVCGQLIVTEQTANARTFLEFKSVVIINTNRTVKRSASAFRFYETQIQTN